MPKRVEYGKCPNGYSCVLGDGPVPCRIMCVGEAPGKVENYTGVPLTGPTGIEFNQLYLPLAGLDRGEVYVTNTVKHTNTINRKPTARDVEMCAKCRLYGELDKVSPWVVILMGATACSMIPEIDLEVEHGIPRQGRIGEWEGWVVPMYHPALGLHTTSAMTLLLEDWEGLKGWLRDRRWRWAVDSTERDYRLARSQEDLVNYFKYAAKNRPHGYVGIDTETHGGKPHSIQISLNVGTGCMVLMEDEQACRFLVKVLQTNIDRGVIELILHNAPADLDMIYKLGIHGFKFRDTMQEAYHLGDLPQGLKALSYRLLGRKRKSWEETVIGPSKRVLVDWITEAIEYANGSWTTTVERVGKKGQRLKPTITTSDAEKALWSVFRHTIASEDYDPWVKLRERVDPKALVELENDEVLGSIPVKGIGHCTLEEQVEYGCSDADDTLAVAIELEKRRNGFMKVTEGDSDE